MNLERAGLIYAYDACIFACCLYIRSCALDGRRVWGVFPVAENKSSKTDHTLDNYVRPNRVCGWAKYVQDGSRKRFYVIDIYREPSYLIHFLPNKLSVVRHRHEACICL